MKHHISRGALIIFLGLLYGIATTNFFGGHLFPQSADECIVDGIALVIIAIGMAVGGDKP